jgi:ectoine hydroxylase-related dioxygenase (phytanoyl-CoA dioxygenase family)
MINFLDLTTKGYIVIPNFFNESDIERFVNDYAHSKRSGCENYFLTFASNDALRSVLKKINLTLSLIRKTTNLDIDYLIPHADYFNNQRANREALHQDYEPFYIFQQNHQYINFWIPLIKTDSDKSGLRIVPMDTLIDNIPEYKDKVLKNGATRYYPELNTTHVTNHNFGIDYDLPFNINKISVVPTLNPGDALVMRGDLIHCTQDTETERVAVSLRCTKSDYPIVKELHYSGCEMKKQVLKGMPSRCSKLKELWEERQSDSVTAEDLYGSW